MLNAYGRLYRTQGFETAVLISLIRIGYWDFLLYLARNITANCICKIDCLALDGFKSQYCSQTKQ